MIYTTFAAEKRFSITNKLNEKIISLWISVAVYWNPAYTGI